MQHINLNWPLIFAALLPWGSLRGRRAVYAASQPAGFVFRRHRESFLPAIARRTPDSAPV